MKNILELEVLTKMGYVKDYESSDLNEIVNFAKGRHGDAICRLIDQDKILFSGRTSSLEGLSL